MCFLFCSPVQKPEKLSSVCVAGAIRDGLCAYTALHTHARMAAGHTLLVMDGASVCKNNVEPNVFVSSHPLKWDWDQDALFLLSPLFCQSFGLMCIQLACYHGVKVLTTSHSPQKRTFLEQLRPSVGLYGPTVWCVWCYFRLGASLFSALHLTFLSVSFHLPLSPHLHYFLRCSGPFRRWDLFFLSAFLTYKLDFLLDF